MQNHPPFYKYMSRRLGRVVMENHKLRWSTPGTLNDPYDSQFDMHVDVDRDAVVSATVAKVWEALDGHGPIQADNPVGHLIRYIRRSFPKLSREQFFSDFSPEVDSAISDLEKSLPAFHEQIRHEYKTTKLLCLSERADIALMWAHYAEGHRGIVLRFRSVEGLDSPWSMARPVKYSDDIPRLFDSDFLSDMYSGRVTLTSHSITEKLVFTKSSEWAYEREWRIQSGDGQNPTAPYEDIPFDVLELDGIIVGARMPEEDRQMFCEIAKEQYPHAHVMEAQKDPKAFRFDIKPLSAANTPSTDG